MKSLIRLTDYNKSDMEEVSADVIDTSYFAGYEFKKCLLEIQQAVMIYNLMD